MGSLHGSPGVEKKVLELWNCTKARYFVLHLNSETLQRLDLPPPTLSLCPLALSPSRPLHPPASHPLFAPSPSCDRDRGRALRPYHHAPRSIRSGPPLGALISLCRPLRSWNSYGHTGASCLGSLLRYSTLDFPIWFLPRVRVAEHAFALAKIRAKELRPSSSVHLLVSLMTVYARPPRAIAQLCRSLPNRRNAL